MDLPFPSSAAPQAHRLELTLVGAADGVAVRVVETPPWLSWLASEAPAGPGGLATLAFRVASSAPVGTEALVRVGVAAPSGALMAERTYRVRVTAPPSTGVETVSPNPFGTRAEVRYVLAEASRVRLTVYDGLGREVARLATGERLDAGVHTAQLDGSGLASGVYIVRLVAEGASGRTVARTRSIVRLR